MAPGREYQTEQSAVAVRSVLGKRGGGYEKLGHWMLNAYTCTHVIQGLIFVVL